MKFAMDVSATGGGAASSTDWGGDAGTWSIDPVRVAGAIALVDAEGPALESAAADIARLADGADLVIDGRTGLANAVAEFLDERVRVPGKFIHYAGSVTGAVSDAALAVMLGDEAMVDNVNALYRMSSGGDVRDEYEVALERFGFSNDAD